MGVIPGSAVVVSAESVHEAFTRGERTLLDRWNTVEPWCVVLEEAVPMQRCAFTLVGSICRKVIRDCDLNHVALVFVR